MNNSLYYDLLRNHLPCTTLNYFQNDLDKTYHFSAFVGLTKVLVYVQEEI
jgi:hypothetical protein